MKEFVGLYLAYVVAMNAIPGPWRNWSKGAVVDNWTVMHIAWGIIARSMGIGFYELLGLSIANEVSEAIMRKYKPGLTWGTPESPTNVGMDLVTTQVGWWISG